MKPLFNLYIASWGEKGGICHAVLNDDGSLTEKDWVHLPYPTYHILENQKLYTLCRVPDQELNTAALTVIPLNQDASLKEAGEFIPFPGKSLAHLCRKNGITYTVNYFYGTVQGLKDGEKAPYKILQHRGHGPNPDRQEGPHTHFLTLTPEEKYLLCTDLGLDAVFIYDLDLNEIGRANVPAGCGPRHLIFSPDGKYLYCANEVIGSVTVFRYEEGRLTPLKTYSTLPEGFTGQNTVAAIRLQDGYLYVSNRGHDSIAVFQIAGEELILKEITSCLGQGPRDFAIFGSFLLCTNEQTDDVTVLNLKDHHLTPNKNRLSLEHPLCILGTPIC